MPPAALDAPNTEIGIAAARAAGRERCSDRRHGHFHPAKSRLMEKETASASAAAQRDLFDREDPFYVLPTLSTVEAAVRGIGRTQRGTGTLRKGEGLAPTQRGSGPLMPDS